MSFGAIPHGLEDTQVLPFTTRPAADICACRYCGSRLGVRDDACRQCGAPSHLPALPDRPMRFVIDEELS